MVRRISFNSCSNDMITLLCIPSDGCSDGSVRLYLGTVLSAAFAVDAPNGWKYDLALLQDHEYILEAEDSEIPYAYLFRDDRTVLEDGITFIDFNSGRLYRSGDMAEAYDQPYRNQFHFSVIRNWMNDPNGLCFYKGLYHMFYQMNPFSMKWGNVYWGHAVSSDLVSWRHLPIAMVPQYELKYDKDHKGGAYSGCAYAEDGTMKLCFTRSFSKHIRDNTTKEYQAEAVCDGVNVSGERVIIPASPGNPETDFNFRDPKVVTIRGMAVMLIASSYNGICSVLAYTRREGEWVFSSVLFQDPEASDCASFECANFIEDPSSGCSALVVSLQDRKGSIGKRRRMRAYIGRLDGLRFSAYKKQEVDFGTGSYALQMFDCGHGTTAAFSWIVDAYNEMKPGMSWSNGAISLPLICSAGEDGLRLFPFDGLRKLEGNAVRTPCSSCYVWRLRFRGKTWFRLIFAENSTMHIGLEFSDGNLRFIYGEKGKAVAVELSAECSDLEELVIYVDRAVVEVFADRGRISGTKPYFIDSPDRFASAQFGDESKVEFNEIRMLKGIW